VKLPRPDVGWLVLAGVLACAIATLAALGVAIPDVLSYLATGALSAGAGVALQSPSTPAAAAAELETAKPVAPLVELAPASHAP
jgi:hypothetical protein